MLQLPENIDKAAEILAKTAVKAQMTKGANGSFGFDNPMIQNSLMGAGLGAGAGAAYSLIDKDRRKNTLQNALLGGGLGAAGGLGYHFLSNMAKQPAPPEISPDNIGADGKLNPGIDPSTGKPYSINTPQWEQPHNRSNSSASLPWDQYALKHRSEYQNQWYPGGKPSATGFMNWGRDLLENDPRRSWELMSTVNPPSGGRPSDWLVDNFNSLFGK